MRLILISAAAIMLSACGGPQYKLDIHQTTDEVLSGEKSVIVADINIKKSRGELTAISTAGQVEIHNGQIHLSIPYQKETSEITITVASSDELFTQSFGVTALENLEYVDLIQQANALHAYFSIPADQSEDYKILSHILDVAESMEIILPQEHLQTSIWALEYLTDHYLEAQELARQDIEKLKAATYEIPNLVTSETTHSNSVITYTNILLSQLNNGYRKITDTSINVEHLSRFYMNDWYGDTSRGYFEFQNEFSYMRASPAYLMATAGNQKSN